MTTQEFNLEFDILYNNIMSNTAPGLSSYEKSVFLTKAQEQLVNRIYSETFGSYLGFESTERSTQYLRNLVVSTELSVSNNECELPDNLLYIVRETGKFLIDSNCESIKSANVVVTTHDRINRMLRNPFYSNDNTILRLIEGNKLKLYSKSNIDKYSITYIRKPRPIILEDLPEEIISDIIGNDSQIQLSINGKVQKSECELHEDLHRDILDLAVQLAKISWKM